MEQIKTCVDCGNKFKITDEDAARITSFLDQEGQPLTLPKRCIDCRRKRRASNNSGQSKPFQREFKKFPHNRESFNNKRGNRWEQN